MLKRKRRIIGRPPVKQIVEVRVVRMEEDDAVPVQPPPPPPEPNDCFYYSLDRGGRCTAQSLKPCPYKGAQKQCPLHVNREVEQRRRQSMPIHLRYKMGVVE